jgi:hypothetical protein
VVLDAGEITQVQTLIAAEFEKFRLSSEVVKTEIGNLKPIGDLTVTFDNRKIAMLPCNVIIKAIEGMV